MGGLLGAGPLGALGIELLLDPLEGGRWIGVMLLVMASVYLLAIWASVRPTPKRRAIQRGVVVASMVMVLVGLPIFGAPFAVLLMPATALLAIASGLVFGR